MGNGRLRRKGVENLAKWRYMRPPGLFLHAEVRIWKVNVCEHVGEREGTRKRGRDRHSDLEK